MEEYIHLFSVFYTYVCVCVYFVAITSFASFHSGCPLVLLYPAWKEQFGLISPRFQPNSNENKKETEPDVSSGFQFQWDENEDDDDDELH